MNCSVVPLGIEGFAGATAIETSVAAVTVKAVEPLTGHEAAWMVVVPGARPVARPEVLMVAPERFKTRVAAVTVMAVVPLTDPEAAWTVVVPGARPVARPELLMAATEGFKEVQVAELVRFWVEPSV